MMERQMDETLALLTRLVVRADESSHIGTLTLARSEEGVWRVGFGAPDKLMAATNSEVAMKAGATFRDAALRALADPRQATCVMGREESALLGFMGD
jgi:hypothetical protein